MSNTHQITSEKLKQLTEESLTTLAAHKYIQSRSNIQELFNLSKQDTLDKTKKQAEDIRHALEQMQNKLTKSE